MPNNAPNPKSALALLRFEVICHVKALRKEGVPLAECLRSAGNGVNVGWNQRFKNRMAGHGFLMC